MQRIYFDNAATTPLDSRVLAAMMPYLTDHFGNPSSIYSYGRETKMAIEKARKSVAKMLGAHPSEIFFNSGSTEGTNTIVRGAVEDMGITELITSPLEHHATLHTVEYWAKKGVDLKFVKVKPNGHIDLDDLKSLLTEAEANGKKALVALMHANNEIGNLLPINKVGDLCHAHGAYFFCDTTQTVAHFKIDLTNTPVDFIIGSAHKFHGPKGVGFIYVSENVQIKPFMNGGAQERNMRGGTENLYGIVGLAKALELSLENVVEDAAYIKELKNYMIAQLQAEIPNIQFNGDWDGSCLYSVVNVSFPHTDKTEMLLFNLDMEGVCISGGSACSSGANTGSHVIRAMNPTHEGVPIRFSFSKENTKAEIDTVIAKIKAHIDLEAIIS